MTGYLARGVGEVGERSSPGEGAAYSTVQPSADSTVRLARPSPSSLRGLTSPAQRER
jgi:hypothetical protein